MAYLSDILITCINKESGLYSFKKKMYGHIKYSNVSHKRVILHKPGMKIEKMSININFYITNYFKVSVMCTQILLHIVFIAD